MKKLFLSFILTALLLTSIFSCTDAASPQDTDSGEVTDDSRMTADTETEVPTDVISSEAADTKLTLALDGKTEYRIVVGDMCAEAERYAAEELADYIKKMTGTALPIVSDREEIAEHEIAVGVTNRAPLEEFETDEAFHIYAKESSLYLCGGSPRGTLYAVYDLLETFGCRFFARNTEVVPSYDLLEFDKATDIRESPAFYFRDVYCSAVFSEDISAKLRINSSISRNLSEKVGGGIGYIQPYFVHTFSDFVPESYFKTHPEYFAEVNGVRTCGERYQLCMTNDEVLEIVINKVLRVLKREPDAKILSVSQNDIYLHCTCESCAKLIKLEGSPAGPLIRFVNAVADAVADEYPDVYIDTLAYQYSSKPPLITKARDNVMIRFSYEGCRAHPIDECTENADYLKELTAWKKVCPRIIVWDYTANFSHYLAPIPNFDSLAGNIRFWYENGMIGVFEQGIYNEINGKTGEFNELRSYLLAKLMWDPYADVQAMTDEFLAAYYGDAAEYIKEYIDYLQSFYTGMKHVQLYEPPENYRFMFLGDKVGYFDSLWEKAGEAVSGDLRTRVRLSELQYKYIKLVNRLGEFETKDDAEYKKLRNSFYSECKRLGLTMFSEGTDFDMAKKK